MRDYAAFDVRPFLGRLLGFMMCDSLQNCLTAVSIAMATFSEQYQSDSSYVASIAATLFNSTRYTMDVDERAERNAYLIRNVGVDFLKSFWTLNELPVTKVSFPASSQPRQWVRRSISGSGRSQTSLT